MLNFVKSFLMFLVFAAIALTLHQKVSNSICGECATDHTVTTERSKLPPDKVSNQNTSLPNFGKLLIYDIEGETLFSFPEGYLIHNKNAAIKYPVNATLIHQSIFEYLNNQQQLELLITGAYLSHEVNSNTNDNWGQLRALELKNTLVNYGISTDRISTNSELKHFKYNIAGFYAFGVELNVRNIPKEHIKKVEYGVANKVLYSKFSSKTFIPDNTLKAYVIELKHHLDKYPNKKVYIKGYTDNIGSRETNHWFGMQRAETIRQYLIKNGISIRIIKATSRGSRNPISTNSTFEGRAKNRRIEITLK